MVCLCDGLELGLSVMVCLCDGLELGLSKNIASYISTSSLHGVDQLAAWCVSVMG